MKQLLFTIALAVLSLGLHAQSSNAKFNQKLADSLGADQYGMKLYVLVILKTGKAQVAKEKQAELFKGHMQNMGKLVVAGPMEEKNDKGYEGIFILNVKTIPEALALLETDPAIKAGLLDKECYSWYGSAALPMYLPYHIKVQKTEM